MLFNENGEPLFLGDGPALEGDEDCCCTPCDCEELNPQRPTLAMVDVGPGGDANNSTRQVRFVADGGSPSLPTGVDAIQYEWAYVSIQQGTSIGSVQPFNVGYPTGDADPDGHLQSDFLSTFNDAGSAVPAPFTDVDGQVYSAPAATDLKCVASRSALNVARQASIETQGANTIPLRWGGYHGIVLCRKRVFYSNGAECVSDFAYGAVRTGLCDDGAPVLATALADFEYTPAASQQLLGRSSAFDEWKWVYDNVALPGVSQITEIELQFSGINAYTFNFDDGSQEDCNPSSGIPAAALLSRADASESLYYVLVDFSPAEIGNNVTFTRPDGINCSYETVSRPPDCQTAAYARDPTGTETGVFWVLYYADMAVTQSLSRGKVQAQGGFTVGRRAGMAVAGTTNAAYVYLTSPTFGGSFNCSTMSFSGVSISLASDPLGCDASYNVAVSWSNGLLGDAGSPDSATVTLS